MKPGRLSLRGAGQYPGRGGAAVQAQNPHGYDAVDAFRGRWRRGVARL